MTTFQFFLNNLLKRRKGLGAGKKTAVHKKSRRSLYAKLHPFRKVFVNPRLIFSFAQTFLKYLFCQPKAFCLAHQICALKRSLILKQHVPVFPEFPLFLSA